MPTTQYDLVTLAQVKAWVNSNASTSDDAQLQFLITSVSRQVIRELGPTPFVSRNVEVRDGNGNDRMMFQKRPVSLVNGVTLRGRSSSFALTPSVVPPSDGIAAGYIFNNSLLTLIGYRFPIGRSNVVLDYVSGLNDTTFEPVTLASTSYTVINASTFLQDLGVAYQNGTGLVLVKGTPSQGQYNVSSGFVRGPSVIGGGVYNFNSLDIGQSLYIGYRYGWISEDLQQLTGEAVGLLYAEKKHIGQTQSSMGGQRTVFLEQPLPPSTLRKLNLIRTRVPVV